MHISCFFVRKRRKDKSSAGSIFLINFLDVPISPCTRPEYWTVAELSKVDFMAIPENINTVCRHVPGQKPNRKTGNRTKILTIFKEPEPPSELLFTSSGEPVSNRKIIYWIFTLNMHVRRNKGNFYQSIMLWNYFKITHRYNWRDLPKISSSQFFYYDKNTSYNYCCTCLSTIHFYPSAKSFFRLNYGQVEK